MSVEAVRKFQSELEFDSETTPLLKRSENKKPQKAPYRNPNFYKYIYRNGIECKILDNVRYQEKICAVVGGKGGNHRDPQIIVKDDDGHMFYPPISNVEFISRVVIHNNNDE